jgi:putative hydrolase of the HAD superfamily
MKVLLLDVDGVLFKSEVLFSTLFSQEYGVPLEDISEFFRGPFAQCQTGEKDMREELPLYLEKWGWTGDLDSFLTYWFESEFNFDEELNKSVQLLREKGVLCCLASNNEKYRATHLENRLREMDALDKHYFSWSLKSKKNKPEFFEKIVEELGIAPEEVVFIDDEQQNIDAAKSLGIDARLYHDEVLKELVTNI